MTESSQPIRNGDKLDPDQVKVSPAVKIEAYDIGSGTLLRPSSVLTAAHVVLEPKTHPITVQQGVLTANRTSSVSEAPRVHPDWFPRMAAVHKRDGTPVIIDGKPLEELVSVGPDLAILILDQPLGDAAVQLPEVDCDGVVPAKLHCVSAVFHNERSSGSLGMATFFNDATFKVYSPGGQPQRVAPYELLFEPNKRTVLPDQGPERGDSGMGCYDTASNQLSLVATRRLSNPEIENSSTSVATLGLGVELSRVCSWINKRKYPESRAAALYDIDGDGSREVFALNEVGGDSFTLTMESESLGEQAFGVDISNAETASALTLGEPTTGGLAMTLGNFTGKGQALALSRESDGTLRTAAFNGGPEPTVTGAPAGYVQLTTIQLNDDVYDDLVGLRSDGQIDGFVGGPSGLQFKPTIHPVPMRLDADGAPDFVWLDAGSGVHSFSSWRQSKSNDGHTFRDTGVSSLQVVSPGRFRRLSGNNQGVEDVVLVGQGIVFWCTTNSYGGLECKPALDAPYMSGGRIATQADVYDVDLDGLDDVRVFYSNHEPRLFLGQNDGFATNFGYRVPAAAPLDLDGDGDFDTITVEESGGNIALKVRLQPQGSGDFGPFATGIPFSESIALAVGNFNGDQNTSTSAGALSGGSRGLADLAILSGGQVFAVISNGDGSLTVNTLGSASGFVGISASDVNGDGLDDLEATREDGSVTVFSGVASSSGLDNDGQNFTGLPTPDGNDGKMLVLSGLGVDTVGATEARLKLTVGPEDTAALDRLTVQIFDGNNGGLHQFEEETNVLKTCYRLSADPCGDGNTGNCSGGPRPAVELLTVSSDTLGDDVWDTIFDGPHSPAASLAGDGTAPFIYELRVFLSEDCSVVPTPGSTIPVATADAFKVRSNAMVSHPLGEFSFVGSDSDGSFGVPGLPYMRDTNYDGTFSLPIAVGLSATEIQLKEADADDSEDSTPGVSVGAGPDIQYRLLKPDGAEAALVGAEDVSPVNVALNTSGNNDGVTALDVETRIHTITSPMAGIWVWQWENVSAANAVHVFAPLGSPTTHEFLGARRLRPTMTTAQQPQLWRSASSELETCLPFILGSESESEGLVGSSLRIASRSDAVSVLDNSSQTLAGELQRQLLTAKLNWQHGMRVGEDLRGALIYGTTSSVRTTMRRADMLVSGYEVSRDLQETSRIVELLSSVNLGEITYQHPGVPFPIEPMADDDQDGIINVKDNCPTVANSLQADSDGDRVGDACRVEPRVTCVLARSPSSFEAIFGYRNHLSFRSVPLGARNLLQAKGPSDPTGQDLGQPTEFLAGIQSQAFRVPFVSSESVSWTLEGETALADFQTARCSGRELANVGFARQVALFGSESVVVGDYASVIARVGLPSVVSGGDLEIGAQAVVGDTVSAGRTLVGRRGTVLGSAITGGGLERQAGASVAAARSDQVLRHHSLEWWVDFGRIARPNLELGWGEDRRLAPGHYGIMNVGAGAILRLEPGSYQFNSLRIDSKAILILESGETVVHVATALAVHGETRIAPGASPVFGYLGSEPAAIDDSFQGTLIAPRAEVVLGSDPNSRYCGAFLARRLVIKPGSVVEFEEL